MRKKGWKEWREGRRKGWGRRQKGEKGNMDRNLQKKPQLQFWGRETVEKMPQILFDFDNV